MFFFVYRFEFFRQAAFLINHFAPQIYVLFGLNTNNINFNDAYHVDVLRIFKLTGPEPPSLLQLQVEPT